MTPQEIVDQIASAAVRVSTSWTREDELRAFIKGAANRIEALIAERTAPLLAENERLRLALQRRLDAETMG